MTSIKVKFRPSALAHGEGTVYYQIIHDRKVRRLQTDYRMLPSEWDEMCAKVVAPSGSVRKYVVSAVTEGIRIDMKRFVKIGRELDASALSYTADDIVAEFVRYSSEYTLFHFMENIIARLRQTGKIRTAETYRATLNSFRKFRHNKDITFDCITPLIMEDYEAWHKSRGVVPNTISFYTRILRAVYNRAVDKGMTDNHHPFRRVYTGIDKTVKRALPLAVIKRIRDLELSRFASLDFARDMFMMSFYLRGMSFIDMAFLKKTDLRCGYITYRRRKTGQRLSIEWTMEMQQIIDKYPENGKGYLLPVICNCAVDERVAYRNVAAKVNYSLKKVARMAGITVPLTLYVARHSWASAAKSKGIPLGIISEGMGHDSETTTQIYLASLDTNLVDRANSLILRSLK